MNKSDLIFEISKSAGCHKKVSKKLVETISTIVKEALISGEDVTLPGIGKLKVSLRSAREGRNPKTGQSVPISARRVVKFSVSTPFKKRISKIPSSG